MKITAVESCVVSLPYDMGGPWPSFAGKPWTHLEILLVKVETDEGLVGLGRGFWTRRDSRHQSRARHDRRAARDRARRRRHRQHCRATSCMLCICSAAMDPFVFAYSGIEIALWDIRGKKAGQPLHRLLGSKGERGRARVPMRASSATAISRLSPRIPPPPARAAIVTLSCMKSRARPFLPRRTRQASAMPASCSTSIVPGRCQMPSRWRMHCATTG